MVKYKMHRPLLCLTDGRVTMIRDSARPDYCEIEMPYWCANASYCVLLAAALACIGVQSTRRVQLHGVFMQE